MQPPALDRTFSVAPMMVYTDRHFRSFFRLISHHALLYTEMVVSGTIAHNLNSGFLDRILKIDADQFPIAVQVGGDDSAELVLAAKVCEDYGYQEINLNVGCPSDRVQKGAFGAVLMKSPEKVGDLVSAMQNAVAIPVTVKHRIGVDHLDDYEFLYRFVDTVAQAGCQSFSVHARKAWLKGLSPAQNRSIPPLDYERVYQLKRDFPNLEIVINGGVSDIEQVKTHLAHVDGVMVGRAAYHNPLTFRELDTQVFKDRDHKVPEASELLAMFQSYIQNQHELGTPLSAMLKHLLGFFKGAKGSRLWRQRITEMIQQKGDLPNLAEVYNTTIGRFQ